MITLPSGFMDPGQLSYQAMTGPLPESRPLLSRFQGLDENTQKDIDLLLRGDYDGDSSKLISTMASHLMSIQRGITSSTSNLPIRENLEAEAKVLVPTDTPYRNLLPRVPGAGTAAAWRVVSALGGGWGSSYDQPGGGSAQQVFFAEAGAPEEATTTYTARSAAYKIMGEVRSVTGFAQAAGLSFQNNLAIEKKNGLLNLMLKEEHALINGDSTATAKPWGDGSTAYAFDGVLAQIATGNGTPSAHIQTSVGALTFAHIDAQLRRLWIQGAQEMFLLVNAQEQQSIKNIALGSSSVHRIVLSDQTNARVNASAQFYTHPVTGELVPILVSKFVPAGTIIYGAKRGPEGDNAAEVDVLPTFQLPEYGQEGQIQGYTAQDIMPTVSAPLVYKFLIFSFEVFKLKLATCYAKSTGVTAV